jgi:hypothetical protein
VKVSFAKTAPRRYGVFVQRDRAPEIMMSPAPGYDDNLPHDLLHFVAEAEWRLDGAKRPQVGSSRACLARTPRP